MVIANRKYIGFALGAALALIVTAPLLLGSAVNVSAQTLTADELFGGTGATGSGFAAEAGLGSADLVDTVSSIIRVALGFLGVIAVVIILLGGFKWMTSQGNDTKLKDAKNLIYAGIVGLVIVLMAYAIASFVITQITSVTSDTGSSGAPASGSSGAPASS
jgi:ketopantoate hydroxymethyltransferase